MGLLFFVSFSLSFFFFDICSIHLLLRGETYCSIIWNASRTFMSSLSGSHANLLCIFPVLEYVLPKQALGYCFAKPKASSPYHGQTVPRDVGLKFCGSPSLFILKRVGRRKPTFPFLIHLFHLLFRDLCLD